MTSPSHARPDARGAVAHASRTPVSPGKRALRFAWMGSCLLGLVHLLPMETRQAGIYRWDAPMQGELGRWLWAHLIHRSHLHLLLNVLSWIGACALLGPVLERRGAWRWGRWPWGFVLVALGISASLVLFESSCVAPFVGASGLIYAWLVAGACAGLSLPLYRRIYAMVLVGLFGLGFLEALSGVHIGFGGTHGMAEPAILVHRHALGWGMLWGLCSLLPCSNPVPSHPQRVSKARRA